MLIYADTADLADIEKYDEDDRISGFTTNPTIFRNAGVVDNALDHAHRIINRTNKPVSIDGPPALVRSLGPNAIPKVAVPLFTDLPNRFADGVVNWTAVCSPIQIDIMRRGQLMPNDIVSVFAGRIMDTGTAPVHMIKAAHELGCRVLWASTRELYHVAMAERLGCDIITLQPELIEKLDTIGEHLDKVAQRTLKQFHDDNKGLWE
jgi:transaldolase